MQTDKNNCNPVTSALSAPIAKAQELFSEMFRCAISDTGASLSQYQRYLTMQFHLTREVQTYFLAAAGHHDLARKRQLRKFLYDFANEEELHYLVAANDLHALGMEIGPVPFDVVLWHSYFRNIVGARPFIRLGAACVLENISSGVARVEIKRALSSPFLTRNNSKFLVLHQHETLPHGDQILEALDRAELDARQIVDLNFGAAAGTIMYLRMAEWALNPKCIASMGDVSGEVSSEDLERISGVRVSLDQVVELG